MTDTTHDFRDEILEDVEHRPWPMPAAPWIMTQTWHDLLFAHWPVDADDLRSRVPASCELDLFEGQAWLGIVSFEMTNVAPRAAPALPWISAFPEINVRTYVRVNGKPGVYFFSLDATNPVAVWVARTFFHLPYYSATIDVGHGSGDAIDYHSRRREGEAAFHARYSPTGAATHPVEGSLDYFLTERYCLYTVDRERRLYRLDIHHPPWLLRPAVADIRVNTLAQAAGIRVPSSAPLLHFAKRQDVVNWPPRREPSCDLTASARN
jgi:uncharacterized protein YqjF (DUF2071 family)